MWSPQAKSSSCIMFWSAQAVVICHRKHLQQGRPSTVALNIAVQHTMLYISLWTASFNVTVLGPPCRRCLLWHMPAIRQVPYHSTLMHSIALQSRCTNYRPWQHQLHSCIIWLFLDNECASCYWLLWLSPAVHTDVWSFNWWSLTNLHDGDLHEDTACTGETNDLC